ncbi:MAG: ROK family protein [Candidatus Azobacteroides sp.]|nr:ROK family protein [Candidatus Azobacteroides sp.]
MDKPYVIGIDMGGTNTAFGIVDRRGEILFRDSISTLGYTKGEDYVNDLGNAVNDLIEKNNLKGLIKGIGMGVPNGNMNDGTVENAANIPWAKGIVVPLAAMMGKKTGLPCSLTNDANAAALGEMAYGAAKGMKDFIVITLGTGVGSGIVSNGQLVVGHDGFAGELGHVRVIRENGRICGCGRTGCLETYASATGVTRTAREFMEIQPERASVLREIQHRPITSKDVYEAAKKGDKLAIEIFNFTGRILGEAFCDFVAFSSPKAFILFGGLSHSGSFLIDPLKKAMEDHMLNVYKGKTEVLISKLNDAEAAILGASALAWE